MLDGPYLCIKLFGNKIHDDSFSFSFEFGLDLHLEITIRERVKPEDEKQLQGKREIGERDREYGGVGWEKGQMSKAKREEVKKILKQERVGE